MQKENKQLEIFERQRRRLFGIAYRMTGMIDAAEEIVQETYLRWHQADNDEIQNAEAWLTSVTTRLSIDRLRALKHERETYIGPWLPEPLFSRSTLSPEDELEFADNLSIAFMALLERLSPVERAAFILREAFDVSYQEIARIIGKNEPACRQIIHRARERVRNDEPRFETTEAEKKKLIEKFLAATAAVDEKAILSLFAEDAVMTSDGGGRVTAARKTIVGGRKIARLYYHVALKSKGLLNVKISPINGEIGIISTVFGQPFAATVFEIDGEKIQCVYQVMNPEKLKGWSYAATERLTQTV